MRKTAPGGAVFCVGNTGKMPPQDRVGLLYSPNDFFIFPIHIYKKRVIMAKTTSTKQKKRGVDSLFAGASSRKASLIRRSERSVVVRSIRDGLISIIPVLIIGAFSLILKTFPVPGYQDFIASFAGGLPRRSAESRRAALTRIRYDQKKNGSASRSFYA